MNLSLNITQNATPAGVPADVAAALPVDGAALLAQLLPFPQVIAADAALPEVALAQPDAAPAAPLLDDTATDTQPADAAATPDVLLGAMAPVVTPAALPAMMLAMQAAKPAPAAGQPAGESNEVAATPVAAPRALPELAPAPSTMPATPAARADAVAIKAHATSDGAPADSAAADTAPTMSGINPAAAQPAAARGAERLQLAGPPAAWRQTLHEALGERLQLQLGRGSEQATIRLEPPMLGRIEIAIRHSGGNLEVHIAASNGEVLRQLNTVSDSLRGDLAGRQYANVSVSVTETPRAQATAQAGQQPSHGGDAQGRRQSGDEQQQQQQQRTPGLALNDAGQAGSLFSLNGRE